MPICKVNVKWGKEKFTDIECDTDESPVQFKAQLFALSGVQPDRQKVMVKGGVISDDSWGSTKLRDGMTLMMMGSAEPLPQAPTQKTVFVEDLNEQELASANQSLETLGAVRCMKLPAGLQNLGNTCYMNATLQCLRSVPELKDALMQYGDSNATASTQAPSSTIARALKDLYKTMDLTSETVPPIIFLRHLHMLYPRFAEKTEQGHLAQQDANEFWTEIVRCLQINLPKLSSTPADETATSRKGFMDQYFAGEWDVSMKCTESEAEQSTHTTETFYQMSCFIEKEVKYMNTGLKSRLEEHITKHSVTLDRDAIYQKSSKLSRLPAYLSIQFVRFQYKGREAVSAKILKDVKFTLSLDVFDLCTGDLQNKLLPMREQFKKEEDRLLEVATKMKQEGLTKMETDEKKVAQPFSFTDDVGSNSSGFYELNAVLTHKGRSSASGHYVAWVRKSEVRMVRNMPEWVNGVLGYDVMVASRDGPTSLLWQREVCNICTQNQPWRYECPYQWLMFDDDNVAQVKSDDIIRLSGGGDWHCAYVLLYGPRILTLEGS